MVRTAPFFARHAWAVLASMALMSLSVSATADLLEEFLRAADGGECIEHVTYRMVEQHGVTRAAEVVTAALGALAVRTEQQRALGCDGDIAAQAIAAGADPTDVLSATAAGL